MLIAGKSKDEIANLKKSLSTQFAMKDLGDANHFLGMRIKRDRQRGILELSQEHYVHKVLEGFSMQGGNTLSTPMQPCLKLSKDDCPKFDVEKAETAKVPYFSAVGGLMYAMVATRPDIAFAMGVFSRYMANPGKKHWDAVKHLLSPLLAMYSSLQEQQFHGDQTCTSSSMIESEYVAASSASKEAVWLARLVGDLEIHQILVLHCDSQSAITLAKNLVFHSKTKHIEVRYHVVRNILATKRIELVKVHTDDNPADVLTKSLASERFTHCSAMMGIG
ncbi:hypothetical protein L7F22_061975 [Adiantum nelumboides]|nr:hypothetical protein [Adiantum nelumboides]